jgi:hypothetical protein
MRNSGKAKLSKAQCNKKIRTVLLKYNVDLSQLNYSAYNKSVYMGGVLIKNNGYDLTAHAILELVQDLSTHGHIRCNLDNWFLSTDNISYIGNNYTEESNTSYEMQA